MYKKRKEKLQKNREDSIYSIFIGNGKPLVDVLCKNEKNELVVYGFND